jgi:hypothetical protein
VSPVELTDGRGGGWVGEKPNHTTARKPGKDKAMARLLEEPSKISVYGCGYVCVSAMKAGGWEKCWGGSITVY